MVQGMSAQQSAYLRHRSEGRDINDSAFHAAIPFKEAVLIEDDRKRGLLEFPSPAAGSAVSQGEPIMAKKTAPGDAVTNLSETKEIVRNAVPELVNLKKERKAINEQMAAIRERVNAAGIPKKALEHAIRVREMEPDDREAFDEGYAIVRDVIGCSMSRSLFDYIDTGTRPASEPANEDETADAAA